MLLAWTFIGCKDPAADGSAAPASTTSAKPSSAIIELEVPAVDAGEIVLDGKLNEAAWGAAADTGPFVHPGTGAPATGSKVQGSARLMWDDRFLYVGVVVADADVRGGFAADAVDPHLWERDCVELMVDPDGDGDNRDYYEIQINPQGLVFDSQFDDYNKPRGGPAGPFGHESWKSDVEVGVALEGTIDNPGDRDVGYTVEARLPWASLTKARRAPPQNGDRWRVNLYAMQNNGGVAWSPILRQGNFHRARRFGRLIFASKQ